MAKRIRVKMTEEEYQEWKIKKIYEPIFREMRESWGIGEKK